MARTLRVALVGDFDPSVVAHRAIPMALNLAGWQHGVEVQPVWAHTSTISRVPDTQLASVHGIWCVPASPYASNSGALAAIRYARESGRPFLGTCGGFQHALLEYARNVLGVAAADHAELHPDAAVPLIAPLACSLVEQTDTAHFADGSRLRAIYGADSADEPYRCRYGLNPDYERLFAGGPLRVAARGAPACGSPAGEVRAVELVGHPFFVATLYQPE